MDYMGFSKRTVTAYMGLFILMASTRLYFFPQELVEPVKLLFFGGTLYLALTVFAAIELLFHRYRSLL